MTGNKNMVYLNIERLCSYINTVETREDRKYFYIRLWCVLMCKECAVPNRIL